MSTFILWDVDGTLVRNAAGGGELYGEAIESVLGRRLDVSVPRVHGGTDGQIIWDALALNNLPAELHMPVSVELDRLSRERHLGGARREISPGVLEALAAFTDHGWVNALLTGNSANRARYKLSGAGLDDLAFDWSHSYFGDSARLRSDITRSAAAGLAGSRVVIIGDTPADDAAAAAAGIPFIGVATGAYSVEELRATGGIAVVSDLATGLTEAVAAIDALRSGISAV